MKTASGCKHRPESEMGYLMASDDAQERMKRGEKQKQCEYCGLWIWESYYGPADWPTRAMDGGQCIFLRRPAEKKK